jgi:hypothetical protein
MELLDALLRLGTRLLGDASQPPLEAEQLGVVDERRRER